MTLDGESVNIASQTLEQSRLARENPMIYFVHNKTRNAVKIGFSENSERRFLALQTVSLDDLKLIGEIEGDRTVEKLLHQRFKEFRIRGEWFLASHELMEYIRDMVDPLTILGVEIESFYLAGKFTTPDWRSQLIKNWPGSFASVNLETDTDDWNNKHSYRVVYRGNNGRKFSVRYTGPFCMKAGENGPHMYSTGPKIIRGDHEYLKIDHSTVVANCLSAINRSDLIFAWIDSWDCFGTLAEIGYASALQNKIVVVATPRFNRELWFACAMADRFIVASSPIKAWTIMWYSDHSSEFEVKDELFSDIDCEDDEEIGCEQEESRNGSCGIT